MQAFVINTLLLVKQIKNTANAVIELKHSAVFKFGGLFDLLNINQIKQDELIS